MNVKRAAELKKGDRIVLDTVTYEVSSVSKMGDVRIVSFVEGPRKLLLRDDLIEVADS